MKEKNRVVIAAWVLLALLGAAVNVSAALTLWCSQYASLFNAMIPAEDMELYLTCVEVSTVAGTLGAIALLAGVIAYVVLLTCHVTGKKALSHKQKWVYTAVTAGVMLVPSLVMGLCDPVNPLFDYYLFTPVVLVGVLVMCVVLEYGLKALQKRKDKQK